MNQTTNNDSNSSTTLPLTINLHVTRACNYHCACCYAHFEDAQFAACHMDRSAWGKIIDELADLAPHPSGRARKITFSGGEPTLVPYLPDLVRQCRQAGFATSVITNGSTLASPRMAELFSHLDWLAVSLDSADPATLRQLGRCCDDGRIATPADLAPVFDKARQAGCRIKLNTVVSQLNKHEHLGAAVAALKANRWKVLQMMTVAGQNDGAGDKYGVTKGEFDAFVAANTPAAAAAGVTVVPEDTEAIAGSYCMVGPNGCFFDDFTGQHRYSHPILKVGVQAAFAEMYFDPATFEARGGSY